MKTLGVKTETRNLIKRDGLNVGLKNYLEKQIPNIFTSDYFNNISKEIK